MFQHHIRQTVYSIIALLIVGGGLYVVMNFQLPSQAEEVETIAGLSFPIHPDIAVGVEEIGSGDIVSSQSTVNPPEGLTSYYVTAVINGNTIIVDDNRRIRLAGIKAPGKDEEFGVDASDFLSKMIKDKEILFQLDTENKEDDFGRLRGVIYIGSSNVNLEMVRAGLAHIYPITPSFIKYDSWELFEKEAQQAKRGLWGGEPYHNYFVPIEEELPEL